MNGTSMSSPNAAGCAALLLSGLLARGLPWTPYGLRRALEESAAPITGSPDVFTAGRGMLRVDGAWPLLVAAGEQALRCGGAAADGYPFGSAAAVAPTPPTPAAPASAPPAHPVIEITVPGGGAGVGESSDRGIYLRDPSQSNAAGDATVWVTPVWREGAPPEARVAYQQRVALSTSAPSWVSVPTHITLASNARSFLVHVDPSALAPGRAHYAEVVGVAAPGEGGEEPLGPLFRLPITVIKPEAPLTGASSCTYTFAPRSGADCVMHGVCVGRCAPAPPPPVPLDGEGGEGALDLAPGTLHRRFLAIPHGATWAEVVVARLDGGGGGGSVGARAAPPAGTPARAPPPSHDDPFCGVEAAARGAADALTRVLRSPPGTVGSPAPTPLLPPPPHSPRATAPLSPRSPPPAPASDASLRTLAVHAMQLARNVSPKLTSTDAYLRLAPGESDGIAFPLFPGGRTLEVTVAQFWSSLGATSVAVEVRFHGVAASAGDGVVLTSAAGFAPLTLTPTLHDVTLRPVGKLTSWTTTLEPVPYGAKEKAVVALPPGRDSPLGAPGPAYALNLRYKLSLPADVAGAMLRLPALSGLLYESGVDAQLAVVAGAGGKGRRGAGRVVAATDAFPEKLKLKKGDYVVHVQLRADSAKKLEALRAGGGPACEFTRKLEGTGEVALGVTGAHPGSGSGAAVAPGRLRAGLPQTVFVTAPAALPKEARAGDVLKGWLLLEDALPRTLLKMGRAYAPDAASAGALVGRHPTGLPVTLFITAAPPPAAAGKEGGDAAPATAPAPPPGGFSAESVADALRAAVLAKLKGLKSGGGGGGDAPPPAPPGASPTPPAARTPFGGAIPATAEAHPFAVLSAAVAECAPPHYLPLLTAQLTVVDEEGVGGAWAAEPPQPPAAPPPLAPAPTLAAVAALVAAIDERDLAAYFGTRHEGCGGALVGAAAKAAEAAGALEGKRRSDEKAALVDALWRAVRAQCYATWAAVASGSAALPRVPPAAPRSGGAAAATGSAPALPAVALPPPPPGDAFEAAVAALNAWAPTTGAAGPHAPLIAVERALRAGRWACALDAANKAAAGAAGLGGLHPQAVALLQLHCVLALEWARPAARAVEAYVMHFTAWPVMM
jgi:hypothetical protein